MKMLSIDIETTGLLFSSDIVSIGTARNYALPEGETQPTAESWIVNGADLYTQPTPIPVIVDRLGRLIDEAEVVTMHNASFDLAFLLGKGFVTSAQIKGKLFDTLLTARMTGPRPSLSLANLCAEYNIGDNRWRNMKRWRSNIQDVPMASVLEYNGLDALHTLTLADILWHESVKIYGQPFTLRESDYCRIMAEIRVRGKPLDRASTVAYTDILLRTRRRLLKFILFPCRIQGPNDRTGLIKYLKRQGLENVIPTTEKGNDSVSKDALNEIITYLASLGAIDPLMVCKTVQKVRHMEKILSTYLDPLLTEHADINDIVHPAYTVAGTVTYRLSSSHPNGQNMPRELNHILWQPYLSGDYSQAEMRLAATYAQETGLAQAFADGKDVHLETALHMFGIETGKTQRQAGKSTNFTALYGGGANTMVQRYGYSFDDARAFLQLHRKTYPRLHKYTRIAKEIWEKRGYIKLISGKRLYATKDDLLRAYKAFNNLIQGGVAELVKEAMMQIDAVGIPMLGQEHDAIGFPLNFGQTTVKETVEAQEAVQGIMDNILPDEYANRTVPPIRMKVEFETKGTKLND